MFPTHADKQLLQDDKQLFVRAVEKFPLYDYHIAVFVVVAGVCSCRLCAYLLQDAVILMFAVLLQSRKMWCWLMCLDV